MLSLAVKPESQMAKYLITEKTPKNFNGRQTPPAGTVIDLEGDRSYEVRLGILAEPSKQPSAVKAADKSAPAVSGETKESK